MGISCDSNQTPQLEARTRGPNHGISPDTGAGITDHSGTVVA